MTILIPALILIPAKEKQFFGYSSAIIMRSEAYSVEC